MYIYCRYYIYTCRHVTYVWQNMTACNFTAVQFCMISALALVKFSGPVFSTAHAP